MTRPKTHLVALFRTCLLRCSERSFLDGTPLDALLMGGLGVEFSRFFLTSLCLSSTADQFCGTIPQTMLLEGFYLIQSNHYDMNEIEGYQFMQKYYYQPYTIASCVADVVKDASDPASLRFARISETESELIKDREMVPVPGLTKGQIINHVSSDDSDFRVHWVDLPIDVFNTGVPGAVIVNPQGPNSSSYNITTCTLNAGWGSSTALSSTQTFGNIYSHMSNIPSFGSDARIVDDNYGYLYSDIPIFANISNFAYPQRRISISKNWMEFLNPTVVLGTNLTGKFISLALSSLQSQYTEVLQPSEANVARLMTLLLSVAMADTGSGYDWEGSYSHGLKFVDCSAANTPKSIAT